MARMGLGKRIKNKVGRVLRGERAPVVEQASPERIQKIEDLAKIPMTDDKKTRRVEIIMLKFTEAPEVIDKAVSNIINRTEHPFKLTVFDNRLNTANMARIWNKLVGESTCDYVCLIDSDAFVPQLSPCWLTRMMESIDETGVVVAMGDNVGGENQADSARPYPASRRERGVWTGFCFLFKKSVWEKMPFDERFYMYGQDSAWAHLLGKKDGVVLRTDTLVEHLHGYSAKKNETAGTFDRVADKRHASSLLKRITDGESVS
jgi:hypothetical protein